MGMQWAHSFSFPFLLINGNIYLGFQSAHIHKYNAIWIGSTLRQGVTWSKWALSSVTPAAASAVHCAGWSGHGGRKQYAEGSSTRKEGVRGRKEYAEGRSTRRERLQRDAPGIRVTLVWTRALLTSRGEWQVPPPLARKRKWSEGESTPRIHSSHFCSPVFGPQHRSQLPPRY